MVNALYRAENAEKGYNGLGGGGEQERSTRPNSTNTAIHPAPACYIQIAGDKSRQKTPENGQGLTNTHTTMYETVSAIPKTS